MSADPRPSNVEIAERLEKRADDDDAFEREIVNNGGGVSARAKERTALDRLAARALRECDEALDPFERGSACVEERLGRLPARRERVLQAWSARDDHLRGRDRRTPHRQGRAHPFRPPRRPATQGDGAMSRSGYIDDCENVAMWRGQVASAIRGKRGQAFLRELVAALDALPEKRLIANYLRQGGEVCAIGSVGAVRGVDMDKLDADDPHQVANAFGIAHQLAAEIEFMNDEAGPYKETPEQRWVRIRAWAVSHIKEPAP